MRIGFIVNDVRTEEATYTTTRLAVAAINRAHEVWTIGVGDLEFDHDEHVRAQGRTVAKKNYKRLESYLRDLQGPTASAQRITVDDLDILMLRNDPAADAVSRPWASAAGILFGRVAMRHGVIVLNDPNGLSKAMTKMYFQLFPEEVRPKTLITRNRGEIKQVD